LKQISTASSSCIANSTIRTLQKDKRMEGRGRGEEKGGGVEEEEGQRRGREGQMRRRGDKLLGIRRRS
jgi:hypothetical protein